MVENANSHIQMDFLEVCSFGDLERAMEMLKNEKIDRSFQHRSNGWTALHWAARRNHQEIVELLLRAGFNPKSTAKDGKTPLDLVTNEAVKEMLKQTNNVGANQEDGQAVSFSHEMSSNAKCDSLLYTRFLLVRTRVEHGKECFKRIAVPGCGSIDVLKSTIERAMKKGKVLEVITLPDQMKIMTEEQIRNLPNHQKVDVVFNSAVIINKEANCTQTAHSKQTPHEIRKCLKLASCDTNNFAVGDSFSRTDEDLDSNVVVTSEFVLTARLSSSATDIRIPSKFSAEDSVKLQVVSSQGNNDGIDLDESVQITKSEAKQDHDSIGPGSEKRTKSPTLSLSPEANEEWNNIMIKNASRKRILGVALLIGFIVGFSGLIHMLYRR